MRAILLNLDTADARRGFMAAQLDALGLPWERIAAVTPETLDPPATDPAWHRWERPLRPAEMAACASHMRAWSRVRDIGAPCLVLEDDALLDRAVPGLLADLQAAPGAFDHVSLETRGRKKVLARRPHPALPLRRLHLDRTGAAAYVLWPSGAAKLLARAERARGLADGLICAAGDLRSWQADPALAIQLDRAAHHGLASPLDVVSQIDGAPRPGKGGLPFRLRRLRAQVSQGLRQLRPGTERREVAPAGDWITGAPATSGDAS